MKTYAFIFTGIIVVINALALVAAFAPYQRYITTVTLAVAAWLLIRMLLDTRQPNARKADEVENEYELPKEALPPVAAPATPEAEPEPSCDWDHVAALAATGLLASLQDKGRMVDFLMEDLSRASDAQVGAAARVVHSGCRSVLQGIGTIGPVSDSPEGSMVAVAATDTRYRLSGKLSGPGPFNGKLLHKGWQIDRVQLPRPVDLHSKVLPPIAPAQVEVI